jgi:hypothetical protein
VADLPRPLTLAERTLQRADISMGDLDLLCQCALHGAGLATLLLMCDCVDDPPEEVRATARDYALNTLAFWGEVFPDMALTEEEDDDE